MSEYEAKVSFFDSRESAVDAVVSVADEHLAIEVDGRPVGRWPIDDLSPRVSGDSVVVSAEGEDLVIDVTDPDELRVSLRLRNSSATTSPPEALNGERRTRRADHEAVQSTSDEVLGTASESSSDDEHPDPTALPSETDALREEITNLEAALEAAQTQLMWVQELVPRRLPIPVREGESGLGVVQGVRLKERRPLPGADGLQPWVVVDSGNVYLTNRRLAFSGVTDIDFEFDDIDKKGASKTGLLLGVSSRIQSHILAGPGERLAVVLTAAEKIAKGLDPTLPFKGSISRLTSEIQSTQERLELSAAAASRP